MLQQFRPAVPVEPVLVDRLITKARNMKTRKVKKKNFVLLEFRVFLMKNYFKNLIFSANNFLCYSALYFDNLQIK